MRDWDTVWGAADGVLRIDPMDARAKWLLDVAGREVMATKASGEGRQTLHEAIAEVLKDTPEGARPAEIAAAIRKRSSYFKRGGGPPTAGQIRLRSNQYREFFEQLGDGRIILSSGGSSLRSRVYLHDDLLAILREVSPRGLSFRDLAAQVNKRRRYHRGDGREVPPDQVRRRVLHHRYKRLFRVVNGMVSVG